MRRFRRPHRPPHLARALVLLSLASLAAAACAGCAFRREREPATDMQVSRTWERAEALLKEGRKGEARGLYGRIAERFVPNRFTAHAYLRLGILFYEEAEYRDAREALIESMRHDTSGDLRAHSSYYLGLVEYQLKDWAQAQVHLATHLSLMPGSTGRAQVLRTLGEIDVRQGHPLLALMRFSQAQEASTDPKWRADLDSRMGEIVTKRLDRPELSQVATLYAGTILADRAQIRLAEMAYLESRGVEEAKLHMEEIVRRRHGESIAGEASLLLERLRSAPPAPKIVPSRAIAGASPGAIPPGGAAPPGFGLPPGSGFSSLFGAPAAAAETRTIGCLLPLTGRYAAYGEKALRGILLAAGAFSPPDPAALGARWIVKDTRGDPAAAALAVYELAQIHGAIAAVGPMTSAEADSAGPKADEVGLPVVTFAQRQTGEPPARGRNLLRNTVADEALVRRIAGLAVTELGIHRFAILHPKDPDGEAAKTLFLREVALAGGEVVAVEGYDPSTTDFAEPIARLVHARREETRRVGDELVVGFDALFLPDSAQTVALIAPQLAYHDLTGIQILGTNRLNTARLVRQAGSYVQGALFVDLFSPSSADPPSIAFVQAYRAAYSEPPGILEALAYDSARAILETAARPGVRTSSDLRDGLLLAGELRGVAGLTRFDANGEAQHEVRVLTVQGDSIVEVRARARSAGGSPPPGGS